MTPEELKRSLVGVVAFCPTPFGPEQELRPDDLAAQIDYLCGTGATSIVVCGGVGEFYALDPDEYRTVVATAVQAANRRLPVIVGIGAATRAACALAEHAAASGAAGILVNPLQFLQPSRRGLRLHYQAIGDASGLGTIVFTHHQAAYGVETLRELAEVESLVGVKDEYGDLRRFVQARAALGSRLAWVNGTGEALAASYFAAGAEAFTSGLVNFAPELTLAIWTAGADGRLDDVRELVEEYVQPITNLRAEPGYSTTVVKEAMNLCGRPGGSVRPPLVPLEPGERAELKTILERLRATAPAAVEALVEG